MLIPVYFLAAIHVEGMTWEGFYRRAGRTSWLRQGKTLLVSIGARARIKAILMVIQAQRLFPRAKGIM